MPTYQYACTNVDCGNRFELVQSFTDPAASACPACNSPVRKVYGSVGVVFKGSGFYRTDSRAANGSGKAKSESSSSSSTSGDSAKSSASSESKSDSKSSSATSTSGSGGGSSKVAASA